MSVELQDLEAAISDPLKLVQLLAQGIKQATEGNLPDSIGQSSVVNLTTDLAAKIPSTQKGVANGVASLGNDGKVPLGQLPAIGGGAVDSVNGQTGVVVLDTDDVSEGTAKYFSAALAKAATVADAIVDGVTDVAPSQNAVFDALAAKVADSITDGVTTIAPSQNAVFDALAPLIAGAQQSQTRWVDKTNGSDSNNGSPSKPFQTIQAAINSIGPATSAADVKKPCTVIVQGGIYDESITLPGGRLWSLLSMGTVCLGDGAGANFASTTPRNITLELGDSALVFGSDIKPCLNLGAFLQGDTTSTFLSYAGSWLVSGGIIAGPVSGGNSHTINLFGVKVFGTMTKTASGLTNLQMYRSYVVGALNMPTATILERAYDCEFQGLVSVDGYNSMINCEIKAGMTVTTNFNTLPPSGIYLSSITGTFTGPAGCLKVDKVTNHFVKANSVTLGGSATKIVQSGDDAGLTAARPSGVQVGYQYFDTTLVKPIWWSGSAWVDATGSAA